MQIPAEQGLRNAVPEIFEEILVIDHGFVDEIEWFTYPAPIWGGINGYVHIPEGHPWHGVDYFEVPVEVHGGLTFGPRPEDEDRMDTLGWVGFDTNHYCDRWPSTGGLEMPAGFEKPHFCREGKCECIYWEPHMVVQEAS